MLNFHSQPTFFGSWLSLYLHNQWYRTCHLYPMCLPLSPSSASFSTIIKYIYFFIYLKDEREREQKQEWEMSSITHQMPAAVKAGPGQKHMTEAPSRTPTWVTRAKALEPECWIRSGYQNQHIYMECRCPRQYLYMLHPKSAHHHPFHF